MPNIEELRASLEEFLSPDSVVLIMEKNDYLLTIPPKLLTPSDEKVQDPHHMFNVVMAQLLVCFLTSGHRGQMPLCQYIIESEGASKLFVTFMESMESLARRHKNKKEAGNVLADLPTSRLPRA